MMPRQSSCTPARKVIEAAKVAKPEIGLPRKTLILNLWIALDKSHRNTYENTNALKAFLDASYHQGKGGSIIVEISENVLPASCKFSVLSASEFA